MPNTVVNLGDLEAMAIKYQRALNRHDGIRLKADGSRGDRVDSAALQRIADALETVRTTIRGICEQPVLAVQLIEQTDDARKQP